MSAASAIQNHKDDQIEMSILNPSMVNAAAYVLLFLVFITFDLWLTDFFSNIFFEQNKALCRRQARGGD